MDQFTRTRAGDSWWYERPGVLDSATYSEVQKTLLVSFTAMRMYSARDKDVHSITLLKRLTRVCAMLACARFLGCNQVDVVRRNTDLKNIQDNYFFFKTQVGGASSNKQTMVSRTLSGYWLSNALNRRSCCCCCSR
jgi:hypothetical protein